MTKIKTSYCVPFIGWKEVEAFTRNEAESKVLSMKNITSEKGVRIVSLWELFVKNFLVCVPYLYFSVFSALYLGVFLGALKFVTSLANDPFLYIIALLCLFTCFMITFRLPYRFYLAFDSMLKDN